MKKGRILMLLLAAMLVLVGGYLALKKLAPNDDADTVDTSLQVSSIDQATVDSIKVSFGDSSFTYSKGSHDVWTCDGFMPALDQTLVNSMLADACNITATTLVSSSEADFETYGISDPELVIELVLNDGSTVKYLTGIQNPITGEYYLAVDGSTDIYLVKKTFYAAFANDVSYYATAETLPNATDNNAEITSLKYTDSEDVEFDYRYYTDGNPNTYNYSEFWYYESPVYGEMVLESYTFSQFVTNATTLQLSGAVAYRPTEEQLGEFGFDTPTARLDYTYEALDNTGKSGSSAIVIGGMKDENHYYVMIENGDFVYSVGKSSVTAITDMDPEIYINPAALPVDTATISSIDIKYQGKTYTIDYECIKDTTENGAESTNFIYTINGREVPEASESAYEVFINLPRATYADSINLEPQEFDDSTPVIEVIVHRNTDTFKTLDLKYYDYDGSFCISDFNGLRVLLFNKNTIHKWAEEVLTVIGQYYE